MTTRKPPLPLEYLEFTRHLRHSTTDTEHLLWRYLRARQLAGHKFRRQYPLPPYVLDFYCEEKRLAVEVDGGQHDAGEGAAYDQRRDQRLTSKGIRILRFSDREVLLELSAVLEVILMALSDV